MPLLLAALCAWSHAAPAWRAELGLVERDDRLVYVRHQVRTGSAAERELTAAEKKVVESALAPMTDETWTASCAALVTADLAKRGLKPLDTVWFEEGPSGLALTRAGKEAVVGVLIGDPIGMRFHYPDEETERFSLGPPIRLDRARLSASLEAAERLGARLAPDAREKPPVEVPTLNATLASLSPPRETPRERLESLTFDVPRRPYTMESTRGQWQRWTNRAAAWKNDEYLRWSYGGDQNRYWGTPGSGEIMAMLDPLVTAIDQELPHRLTAFIVWGAREYENVMERVPLRLRDDFWDYVERLRSHPEAAADPERLKEALDLAPPRDKLRGILLRDSSDPLWRQLWEAFHPSLSFRLNPRLDPKAPSAAVGARLAMEYGDHWRFRAGCDYDTKDRRAQGYGALTCDW